MVILGYRGEFVRVRDADGSIRTLHRHWLDQLVREGVVQVRTES